MAEWTLQYPTEIVDGVNYKVYARHLTDNFTGLNSAILDRLNIVTSSAQTVVGAVTWNALQTFSQIPALPASDPTTANQAARKSYVDTQISTAIPTGVVLPYGASTAPSGYLLCDGSAVSRTTYATLFGVIGTTWGSGDGSTTFNVPDMRGRTPIGQGTGAGLTARTIAGTGGAESEAISTSNLPSNMRYLSTSATNTDLQSGTTAFFYASTQYNTGGGTALPIMPPYAVTNFIIKT